MTTSRTISAMISLVGFIAASPASLADGPGAIATAAQHAGLAAAAEDLAGATRHLHHTLNCLVGPDGVGFDAAAGNPCNDAGGAIPQTSDTATRGMLEDTAMKLREALGDGDLAVVKEAAMSAQQTLE